jgi:hypothetical protein
LRDTGFVLCLAGALFMIAGRFIAVAPVWLIAIGVGLIFGGWGCFGYAALRAAAEARALNRGE